MRKDGSSKRHPTLWWTLSTAAVLLTGSFIMMSRQYQYVATQARQIEEMTRENRRLGETIKATSGENATLKQRLAEQVAVLEALEQQRSKGKPGSEAPIRSVEDLPLVRQLKEDLSAAQAAASHSETKAMELEGQVEKSAAENKQLLAVNADLTDQLSTANHLAEALRAELKTNTDRLLQVEVANRKLSDEAGTHNRRLSDGQKVFSELQTLHRRREVYLTNLVNRYRDITEQYRRVSVVIENRRDHEAAGGGAEVSRIQNAISAAEDDLRQIGNLNAQIQRLQKLLPAK